MPVWRCCGSEGRLFESATIEKGNHPIEERRLWKFRCETRHSGAIEKARISFPRNKHRHITRDKPDAPNRRLDIKNNSIASMSACGFVEVVIETRDF